MHVLEELYQVLLIYLSNMFIALVTSIGYGSPGSNFLWIVYYHSYIDDKMCVHFAGLIFVLIRAIVTDAKMNMRTRSFEIDNCK